MRKITLFFLLFFVKLGLAQAEFIKGVTYFADAWPINFWNSSLRNVESDFHNFKKDGFNTVVVVVPWGEFQPDIASEKFNEQAYTRLSEVCHKAKNQGLNFFMRVSYLWDMHPDAKNANYQRFSQLFHSEEAKSAWSRYLKKTSEVTKNCASGAFISWEDYWHVIDSIKNSHSIENRVELSKNYKFHDWVEQNIKKNGLKSGLDYLINGGVYAFPAVTHPDFKYVYEWFDYKIMERLLPLVAENFSDASIEARVDDDPIFDGGKIIDWYSHKKTYRIKSSDYVFTYWAPAMGAENKGEKNSAAEVLKRFNWINKKVSDSSDNKIVIAQLLFEDNTPSAKKNAVIKEGEKPDFFKGLVKPLVLQTSGYVLWGAKDYDANMIFNPDFDLGMKGWISKNNSKIKLQLSDSEKNLYLSVGAQIEQNVLGVFNHFKGAFDNTFLRIKGSGKSKIVLTYAGSSVHLETKEGLHSYDLKFPVAQGDSVFSIYVENGKFNLQSVNLYPFTTIANFRNVHGAPGIRYKDVIGVNNSIDSGGGVDSKISMEKESLATVSGVYGVESSGASKYTWASKKIKTKIFAKSNYFEINGFLPEANASKNCELKIFGNGKNISNIKILSGQEFSLKSEIPLDLVGKVLDVSVESDCKVSSSKDKRDLSFILKGMSIN